MGKNIRLLIADDIKETRELIRQLIELNSDDIEIIAEAENGARAVLLADQYTPDLILMDINMPELNGLEATAEIIANNPNSVVIIMSVQSETEYLKQAMFSGAKEYIIKPFDSENLISTLYKTYNRYHKEVQIIEQRLEIGNKAKLFSFFSTKGGVGKTFVAVNTALVQSMLLGKKTLLLDLDLQFGDVALMMDKANAKTIYDCINDGEYQQYDSISPYLIRYHSNLDVLLAPKSPEEAESVTLELVEGILESVQNHYDTILVDLPISFNDMVLSILDRSDAVFFTTSMDILALKNTRTGLSVMKSLNYSEGKIKIVINRRNESYGIKMPDVDKIFGRKPYISLVEDDKNACLSVNMGVPFLLNPKNKGNKLYKEILDLSQKILKEYTDVAD
jgi:pilus assembly protein CpaE